MTDVKILLENAKSGDAKAQFSLACCYYYGDGVDKDYEKSVEWNKKSAEQGYAPAQYNLAVSYYYGEGIEQNYEKAVYWWTKVAEQGIDCAQNELAMCYKNGIGVEQDLVKAVYWYTKAAEQGDIYAQHNLGVCYENGDGVEQDMQKAAYWYAKAAEQGDESAQEALGWCYESGNVYNEEYQQEKFNLEKQTKGKTFDFKGVSKQQLLEQSSGEVVSVFSQDDNNWYSQQIFSDDSKVGHINLSGFVADPAMFANDNSDLCLLLDKSAKEVCDIVNCTNVFVSKDGKTEVVEFDWSKKMDGKVVYGGNAVKQLLEQIDIEKELKLCRHTGNKAKHDALIRLQQCNGDLHKYVCDVLPVCPTSLRPLKIAKNGARIILEVTKLYNYIINRTNRIKKLVEIEAPVAIMINEHKMLQQAVEDLFAFKF